jgi:predicted ATPase/DNA-binding SARP family transcriptional activator
MIWRRRLPIRLLLFGPPMFVDGTDSTVLPCERPGQLLAYLALRRAWVGRAELAALLWPAQERKLACTNLRKTLFRVRAQPWSRAVEVQSGAMRVAIDTDVADFERALREQHVAKALSLRRGELLAGFDDGASQGWTDWLRFERDRLRVAWRSAALERLAGDIEPGAAIELSAQLLELDPLDEAALHAHMSWLARNGQAGRARRAYQDFVARLARDLAIAPSAQIKALHDSLATTAPAGAAPSSDQVDAFGHGFIGRAVELDRLGAIVAQDDCRLLCLIGPGGVGKTRLARQALRGLAPTFTDGAVFVPLDDIEQPSELGSRLAREIGLGLAGRADPLDQVAVYLRDRHLLLVLDNFEQLAPGAAILEKLLQMAARVKVIVTSRVRLALPSEWLLPLEGLPYPDTEDEDRIQVFDAVRLFVNAAKRVHPGLSPIAEAAAIVDICRQVEGLPLALELAAAWTRVLSCAAIARELRKGSKLLRAVDASRPARHASFETVFERSWQLLTGGEREALARLAVFRGGFTPEAACAVTGAPLPLLGALADKSLLRKDGTRIFLHPLVQQQVAARLESREDRASTEAAHAHFFLGMLTQLRHAVADADRDALSRVETEFENCRSAWRWAAGAGSRDWLKGGAMTLVYFCDHRGRFEEGLALLRGALAGRPSQGDPALAALLTSAAAHLEYRLDRYDEAQSSAERALAAGWGARDHEARLLSLKVLGGTSLALERFHDARRHYRQAVKLAQATADLRTAAGMLDNLALVEKALGRFDEALRMSTQSLVQHRQLGDVAGEALCLNNLGTLLTDLGEHDAADANLRAGLALCENHGLVGTRGIVLANMTDLAMKRGDLDTAAARAHLTLEVGTTTGFRTLVAIAHTQRVRIAARRGDPATAGAELRAAAEVTLALGRPTLLAATAAAFAEVLAAQGEPACARLVMRFAADHPAIPRLDGDELRGWLERWDPGPGAPLTWPDLELADVVQRLVAEANVAYAPLIAQLRGAR